MKKQMIGNQTKGRGFRGLLNYLQSQQGAKLIGGNMGGRNARALAVEFKISRQLNLEADRVVYHASLSLPQGERLDDATWNEIAHRYLEEMGFDSNQYVVYRHSNTQHDHIHICASRIRLDNGKIVHDSWDYKRSESIIRQLERDYGLQQTHSSHEKLSRNPSIGQQRRLEREQLEYIKGDRLSPKERPIKQQLQELIDRATINRPIMPQLIERLQLEGVEVRHGVTRNGKSKGISYSWNGQKFSGTSLGPAYTWPGLQKHKKIDYQPQRDDARIEQLLHNRVGRAVDNQVLINAIVNYIEQSAVESALVETLPELTELTEQLLLYQQQLKAERTTLKDLSAAIDRIEQQLISQKAVDAIVNYIDSKAVESVLAEAIPSLSQSIDQYRHSLAEVTATFKQLTAVLTQAEEDRVSQKAIKAIVDYVEQSAVESVLAEAVPLLSQSIDQYRHSLAEVNANYKELIAALTPAEDSVSQKAIKAIVDYVEQSAVESVLVETVPLLSQSIDQYRHSLAEVNATYHQLLAALTPAKEDSVSQKAIKAIVDYVERSAVESVLAEAVPSLSQSIDQYRHSLAESNANFKELTAALTQNLIVEKPKLNPEVSAELYKHYSAELQNLLVTDRDKEIAIRALIDNKLVQDIEEIILASPAGWTHDEAKALVLIAQNKLASRQEQPEHQLDDKQQLQSEYLALAVPVAVKLINWQLREKGEHSFRFKRATLSKQGRELVFTHDERGEIFRVKVNRNQSSELEYSPINIGELEKKDIQLWHDCDQLLQEIIEQEQQQKRRPSKGFSL